MKKLKGYFIYASISKRSNGRVKGPYKDKNIAEVECENTGWYGSKGRVIEIEFYEDEEGNLFEILEPVKFVDLEKEKREEVLEKIKGKLSPEEWKFISANELK